MCVWLLDCLSPEQLLLPFLLLWLLVNSSTCPSIGLSIVTKIKSQSLSSLELRYSGEPPSANKINNPAVINKGNRIPTTNEPTQCRLSVGSVRVPNQKKRLPIMETLS